MSESEVSILSQYINHYKVSCVLAAAHELGLFEKLNGIEASVPELAQACRCYPSRLQRLLYALELLQLVEGSEGRVKLTERGLRAGHEMKDHLELIEDYTRSWLRLSGVVCGDPIADVWSVRQSDPVVRRAFQGAMRGNAEPITELVLEVISDTGTLVDLGGGYGDVLLSVLASRPKLSGVLLELREVVMDMPSSARGGKRHVAVAGSFFKLPPSVMGHETYLLANVLHDWADDQVDGIVAEVTRAAPSGSKLLIVERMVQPGYERALAFADLHMMVVTGGRQRTVTELSEFVERHGWRPLRILTKNPLSGFTLLEAGR